MIDEIPFNPYTLTFNSHDVEAKFQNYYFSSTIRPMRIGILLFTFAFAIFGVLDYYIAPEAAQWVWMIRYLIVCPLAILIYILSFVPSFRDWWQLAMAILVLAASFGVIAMVALAEPPGSYLYYAGLMMVLFSTFLFLRFVWATLCSWAVVFAYNLAVAIFTNMQPKFMVNNNFFLTFFCISIMFVSYQLDRSNRRAFYIEDDLRQARDRAENLANEMKLLSARDGLTGVANRRMFDEFLEKEWRRNMRTQTPLSLIMFDIDFFKRYNDGYGHQAGDECLKAVAGVIKNLPRRPGDLSARYGGEEFAIILSGTDHNNSMKIAENVRHGVEGLNLLHEYSQAAHCVTISIGVAAMIPTRRDNVGHLIERADEALYEAKRKGRNRVEPYRSPLEKRPS
ncbi:MAG: diguanylate cyclase [Myxococcales bacterium]|nr:MAG: diguanylate cyclase [Myxococcales bacterium]